MAKTTSEEWIHYTPAFCLKVKLPRLIYHDQSVDTISDEDCKKDVNPVCPGSPNYLNIAKKYESEVFLWSPSYMLSY